MPVKLRACAAVFAIAALSGCAGRSAAPVSVTQTRDTQLACSQLDAEMQGNEAKVQQIQKEKDEAHGRNVAVGVVGAILFWPALFALDTSDAEEVEEVEIKALRDRNNHLAQVRLQKCQQS